ncbi:MAG: flavodoxin family protein [Deltaproteobacteria bacterium]|nr:MAG: flavodoxin family protein [Deltaproteobacteria bacterium]
MKALVIYSSRTGNTKALAQVVYDALRGEKELVSINAVSQLNAGYDLIAVGFPVMAGKVEPRAKKLLTEFNKKAQKTKLFLFVTHGSLRNTALVNNVMEQAFQLVKGAEIAGAFTCQGEVNPKIIYKLSKSSRPPRWIDAAKYAKGHPTAEDAEELTEMIANLF